MTEWDSDSSKCLFSNKEDVIKEMPMGRELIGIFLLRRISLIKAEF